MTIDLQAIEERERWGEIAPYDPWGTAVDRLKVTRADVRALIAEVRRLTGKYEIARALNEKLEGKLRRYRELAKVVRGLQQAKEGYSQWYDSKTSQERISAATVECRLRTVLAQKERDVIDAATELLKEAHDAQAS
ncbi:MAG: hypothetical protein IMY86_13740 [Chloroflexi bacterium]|nr:hypothetical protein [Chloroflexota bacterium]